MKARDPLDLALSEDSPARWPSPRNKHLDFSRVDTYERCPRAYQYGYLDKIKREGTFATRFGSLQHAVVDDIVSEAVEQEHVGPLNVVRAEQLFQRRSTRYGLPKNLHESALAAVRTFARHESTFDYRRVVAVEQMLTADVGIRLPLKGKIDRINRPGPDEVEIIDYKGGRRLWEPEALASTKQLGMYELIVRSVWPWVRRATLVVWHLQANVRQTTTRTAAELDALKTELQRLGDEMEARETFEATPGPHCPHCDYRSHCPDAWERR